MYNTQYTEKILLLKKELDSKLPLKSNDEKRLKKKLRLEFNYNSNHLEGNTLTYGQTQLLLYFDKSSGDVSVSDIEEMKAHDVALSQIEDLAKDSERPLTETFIKALNKLILVKPFWKDAKSFDGSPSRKKIEIGQYKSTPNSVLLKNGEIHEYASPEETPALMGDLMKWFNDNLNVLAPVQLAAELHYRFVCIHPFDDGNGRVARLIMNYILLKFNYPPVIIKSSDKENYLTALQKADSGNRLAIIEYIEKQAIWTLELSIKAANGEEIEELGDIEKEIEILKREKLTTAKIYNTPKVTIELVQHINDDVWIPLTKVLSKFDSFFCEITFNMYVNNIKLEYNELDIVEYLSEIYSDQNKFRLKVGAHHFEKINVTQIRWSINLLSLKSASSKIDLNFDLILEPKESNYAIQIFDTNIATEALFRNNNLIFEVEKDYKSYFMLEEIEKIVRIVSNHLINLIKVLD